MKSRSEGKAQLQSQKVEGRTKGIKPTTEEPAGGSQRPSPPASGVGGWDAFQLQVCDQAKLITVESVQKHEFREAKCREIVQLQKKRVYFYIFRYEFTV